MEPTIALADRESESADASIDRDVTGDELIAEELIIEEISIDGMCGVY